MLSNIVSILKESNKCFIDSETLICNNYNITDVTVLEYLYENNCVEQTLYLENLKVGESIDLELSLYHLSRLGIYYSFDAFILKNKYQKPTIDYYIYDIDYFSYSNDNESILKYDAVIHLIEAIKHIAKHSYIDAGIENSILFREDKSTFITFEYSFNDIENIKTLEIEKVHSISSILEEDQSEKKLIYINEIIDFVSMENESNRFKHLLNCFTQFYEKCNNAFQFYLRDFSYNKLKLELDSKALEYTQKIQSVINEAQTKLIAIPTVFVLACAAFDYSDLLVVKNIATIISLFIFAIIIQLFLNNQKSSLNFMSENIVSYKETFKNKNIEKISNKFSLVEDELNKQKKRLLIVDIILWVIPISFVIMWVILVLNK